MRKKDVKDYIQKYKDEYLSDLIQYDPNSDEEILRLQNRWLLRGIKWFIPTLFGYKDNFNR